MIRQAAITDNDLEKFLTWEGGHHLVKVMPNRDEVSAMTIDAFIYFYDVLKSEHTRYVNLAQLHLNQLNMDVVFELLQRIDRGKLRLKETLSISNDFRSHYDVWANLLLDKMLKAKESGDDANEIYWRHEYEVFERSMAHLFAQNFPEIEVPKT